MSTVRRICFADQGETCKILREKDCLDCTFYKTINDFYEQTNKYKEKNHPKDD